MTPMTRCIAWLSIMSLIPIAHAAAQTPADNTAVEAYQLPDAIVETWVLPRLIVVYRKEASIASTESALSSRGLRRIKQLGNQRYALWDLPKPGTGERTLQDVLDWADSIKDISSVKSVEPDFIFFPDLERPFTEPGVFARGLVSFDGSSRISVGEKPWSRGIASL